jgi:hypothetical protein
MKSLITALMLGDAALFVFGAFSMAGVGTVVARSLRCIGPRSDESISGVDISSLQSASRVQWLDAHTPA